MRRDRTAKDLHAALEAAGHFSRSTGIPVRVMDERGGLADGGAGVPAGERQSEPANSGGTCGVCALVYGDGKAAELCRRNRLHGAMQAERFGGKNFYFCTASLLHLSSPIMREGRLLGALVAGPILPYASSEVLWELEKMVGESCPAETNRPGTTNNGGAPGNPGTGNTGSDPATLAPVAPKGSISKQSFDRLISGIQSVDPERVHSLGEVLRRLCADLSDATVELLRDRDEAMELQARLYEYLDDGDSSIYPFAREAELLRRVKEGDEAEARAVLEDLFASGMMHSRRDAARLRARGLELLGAVSRAAVDGGADGDTVLSLNEDYILKLQSSRETEMLLLHLTRAVRNYTGLVREMKNVEHLDVIGRVTSHIRRCYAERITLEDAARLVNLSPSYLSRIFRREMGTGFTAYLNKVRIEKSKVLLGNRDLSLVEVGGMVGYEDQSYFTKVFKRFTGLPPGKYRELRGRFPSDSKEIHVASDEYPEDGAAGS
jgi:AraC-like DNA-binding protein